MWRLGDPVLVNGQLCPVLLEHFVTCRVPQDWSNEAMASFVRYLVETAAKESRLDELRRIKAVTLDADCDVWSTDDDGKLIPLTERIKQQLLP